jgi:hypothetical protein
MGQGEAFAISIWEDPSTILYRGRVGGRRGWRSGAVGAGKPLLVLIGRGGWLLAGLGSCVDLGSLSRGADPVDAAADVGTPPIADAGRDEAEVSRTEDGGGDARDPDLFLSYAFEDDTRDTSGRANHATAPATTTFDPGVEGKALACSGTPTSRVVWGGGFAPGRESFTVAGWFRVSPSAGDVYQTLFSKGGLFHEPTGSDTGFGVGIRRDTAYVHGYVRDDDDAGAGAARFREVQAYAPNLLGSAFRHVALVVDRTAERLVLYVEGAQVSSDFIPRDFGTPNSSTPGSLCAVEGMALSHVGAVDEFRIYLRALTSAEIASLARR